MPPLVNPNTQPAAAQEPQPSPDLASGGARPESIAQAPTVERAAETLQGAPAQASFVAAAAQPLQPASQLPIVDPTPTVQPTQAAVEDVPATDSDGIEKVWVDRADAIISTQQNDPYMQEQQQEDLSAEYLQKRFSLTVKRSNPPGTS